MPRSLRACLTSSKPFIVLIALGATVACNLDNSVSPGTPAGYVQFINAAPRYAAADFYTDSVLSLSSELYAVDTFYVYAPALSTPATFQARIAGDTTLLATAKALVQPNGLSTVVLTQHTVKGGFVILQDTITPPPTGQAEIRLVNVAPGIPSPGTVDVYVTAPNAGITTATPFATNVPFEGISSYIRLTAPDTTTIQVTVTTAGTKTPLLTGNPQTLSSGEARTVLLLDAAGGGAPFQALLLEDVI